MRSIPVGIATLILVPVFAVAMAGAASAATTPAAPAAPPAATGSPPPRFLSGFSHPDLTACQTMNPSQRVCIVPAGVGGGYVIEAAGWATAAGADSALAMTITVGKQICISQTLAKFTGRRYLHAICEVTLATDAPIQIATYIQARNATPDAEGPKVVIHDMAWDGVVSVRGGDGGTLSEPAPASAPPAPAKAKPGH
jgi:hypothetical protein